MLTIGETGSMNFRTLFYAWGAVTNSMEVPICSSGTHYTVRTVANTGFGGGEEEGGGGWVTVKDLKCGTFSL